MDCNEERNRKDERAVLEGFGRGLLFLSALSPPVVHCRTLSLPSSLLPSVRQTAAGRLRLLLFTPSSLPDSTRALSSSIAFQICFYISLPPPTLSSAWKNLQFSAICSGGQKVKEVLRVGYMRTSVTSARNQSLFGPLHLLLAMCLC